MHLIYNGVIDSITANNLYQVTNLNDIIYRLRKTGLNIITVEKSILEKKDVKLYNTTYKLNVKHEQD
jgi:hypothetical protein